MKCYKDIFDIEIYKKNTGMFIILILFLIQFFCIIIYYCNYSIKIKKYVLSITDKFLSYFSSKNNSNFNSNSLLPNDSSKCSPPKNNSGDVKSQNGDELKIQRKINANKSKTVVKKKGGKNNTTRKINISRNLPNKMSDNFSKESKVNFKDDIKTVEKLVIPNKEYGPIVPDFKHNININIDEYLKTDLYSMDYDDALRRDKRTFCQYFIDRIKTEQIILNTFLKYEILKPLPLKIMLVALNIDLYLVINGLFFNENYLSDLLHSESETMWSFVNRIIDRIVIITISGVIINYIIELFFVEESKIKKVLKSEKENILVLKYEIVQIIKNIYKRYNIFIITSIVIMLFSLYYIFCFNNVYPCIKSEWIKSSIIIIYFYQTELQIC